MPKNGGHGPGRFVAVAFGLVHCVHVGDGGVVEGGTVPMCR